MNEIEKKWTKVASDILVGRTITKVEYLDLKKTESVFGWHKRPITFTLDNGKKIIAQMDDEGNDGGVLLVEHTGETMTSKYYPGEKFLKTQVLPSM